MTITELRDIMDQASKTKEVQFIKSKHVRQGTRIKLSDECYIVNYHEYNQIIRMTMGE